MPNGTYGGVRGGLISTYSIFYGRACYDSDEAEKSGQLRSEN